MQFFGNLVGQEKRRSPLIPHRNLKVPLNALLQNPFCALVPGRLFFHPSLFTAPHPCHLTAQPLASRMPRLPCQVSFSWNYLGRFNYALPSASTFAYQTHAIKVLRKQKDFAVTGNPPHYVSMSVNWPDFSENTAISLKMQNIRTFWPKIPQLEIIP